MLICWPVLFALMVFGDSLLATWLGASYRSAATLITVLALPTLVALPQSAASSVLFGVSRHRVVVVLALLNALLNLGLSILWVRPFGLTGVALGTAVPLAIVGGFATGVYAARALGLPLRRYFWEGMARPGIVSLAFLIPALALRAFWRPLGWGPLFVAVAVPWLIFAMTAWRWGSAPASAPAGLMRRRGCSVWRGPPRQPGADRDEPRPRASVVRSGGRGPLRAVGGDSHP